MDSSHANNGNKLQNANKTSTIRSNNQSAIYTQSDSKQTTSNTTNPNDRKIKQIVPLNSKKIKTLGIEQALFSAFTKFNGKERSLSKVKHPKNLHQPSKSTPTPSSSSSSAALSSLLVNLPPQCESPVPMHISSSAATISSVPSNLCRTSPETPSTKKIHVLSNVLLNENKLSLKDFTAIASSTPVNSTNVSYVPQVPVPIKCERVKLEDDPFTTPNTMVEIPTEIITADDINDITGSFIEIEANIDDDNDEPDTDEMEIVEEEQTENKTVRLLQKQTSEIDSLRGFSSNDLKCSQNKCEYLQNEIGTATPTKKSPRKSRKTIAAHEYESDRISRTQSCSTLYTNSEVAVDTCESSDNESDLEELKREAQRIIEISESVTTPIQSPKCVQNDSLDSSAEHIDAERLIDEFLDSTISSFHIPFAAHTADHTDDDSSSDSDASDHDEGNNFDADENEYHDFDDNELEENDDAMIEITEIQVVKEEHIEEHSQDYSEEKPLKSQKRKNDDESEHNFGKTKRKKTNTISEVDDTMHTTQDEPKAINEQIQIPTEIQQGKVRSVFL